ncbi:MAG: NAD-dependent formate dehydrogenase gamma subunit, partial [uncultured Gemmatimonadaceae bacterium]
AVARGVDLGRRAELRVHAPHRAARRRVGGDHLLRALRDHAAPQAGAARVRGRRLPPQGRVRADGVARGGGGPAEPPRARGRPRAHRRRRRDLAQGAVRGAVRPGAGGVPAARRRPAAGPPVRRPHARACVGGARRRPRGGGRAAPRAAAAGRPVAPPAQARRRGGPHEPRRVPRVGRLPGAAARLRPGPRGGDPRDHRLEADGARRRGVPDRAQVGGGGAAAGAAALPHLQRRRERARDVQGPRAHGGRPVRPRRGDDDRGVRHRVRARLHLPARRVPARDRASAGRDRPGAPARAARRRRHEAGVLVRSGDPQGRRRLHLRRGDGDLQLDRGVPRRAAQQAAVPGELGAVPQADRDQQRRDAGERPAHPRDGWAGVRRDRHRAEHWPEAVLPVGEREAARRVRGAVRRHAARAHRPGRRRHRGAHDAGGAAGRRGRQLHAPRRARRAAHLRGLARGAGLVRLGRDHGVRRHGGPGRHAAPHRGVLPRRVVRPVRAVPGGHRAAGGGAAPHRARPAARLGGRRDGAARRDRAGDEGRVDLRPRADRVRRGGVGDQAARRVRRRRPQRECEWHGRAARQRRGPRPRQRLRQRRRAVGQRKRREGM